MNPEEAVRKLAEFVTPRVEFTEDEAYAALDAAGVPPAQAALAYTFTQTAWARSFLARTEIQFSPTYFRFDAAGKVVESGLLAEQPYFIAAAALAPQFASTPGFTGLAMTSADVNALAAAIDSGNPSPVVASGPAGFFLEPPTAAGMAEAQRILTEHVRKEAGFSKKGAASPAKPWWKFW